MSGLLCNLAPFALVCSLSAQELKYMHLEAARELVEVKVGD